MSTSGSLGTLLQGVSQQPPHERPAGKVTEQINWISDVVAGLTPRPSVEERVHIPNAANRFTQYKHVDIEDETYILGMRTGELRVWDYQGIEQAITFTGNSADYVSDDMRS